jgi:hypothetical protein
VDVTRHENTPQTGGTSSSATEASGQGRARSD